MSNSIHKTRKRIFLFDVDGTLTAPRKVITSTMKEYLKELKKNECIGIVGGSDLNKQIEQLGDDVLHQFDYVFSENGLDAYKHGKSFAKQSLKKWLGEDKLKKFINFVLHYIADLDIEIKRGTFIEFRNGMLNISPIGRNCNQEERDKYEKYDLEHGKRTKFIQILKEKFGDYDLCYSIGGQISFDVFPRGWDKTYCLQFLKNDGFTEIHFFGDKTFKGGNDYEIFVSSDTYGHTVSDPDNTIEQVNEIIVQTGKNKNIVEFTS